MVFSSDIVSTIYELEKKKYFTLALPMPYAAKDTIVDFSTTIFSTAVGTSY